MTTSAFIGASTLLKLGDGASPENFNTVLEVRSIGDVGQANDLIEVTHLQSVAKEYIYGLPDGIELPFVVNYNPTDSSHTALLVAQVTRTVKNFKLVLPTSPVLTFSFSALIKGWKLPLGPNTPAEMTFTLKITAGTVSNNRYDSLLLSYGPIGYWRLGEAAGAATAVDSSSSGLYPGAYNGAPVLGVQGALLEDTNTAVVLDGASQWVEVPAGFPNIGDVGTLIVWVNTSDFSTPRTLFSKGSNSLGFGLSAAGLLQLFKAGSAHICDSTVGLVANVWAMLVATKSGSDIHLYLNGVDVTGSILSSPTCANTGSALTIGKFFNGIMDEAAVLNYVLTAQQIADLYAAGTGWSL